MTASSSWARGEFVVKQGPCSFKKTHSHFRLKHKTLVIYHFSARKTVISYGLTIPTCLHIHVYMHVCVLVNDK